MNHLPYRAIALDLDGTLTNHDKVMVAKNAADLKPLTTVITEEAGVTEKVRPCLLKEVK